MIDGLKRPLNTCAICGSHSELAACGDGFVCQPCASRVRDGKDATTRKTKMVQRALHDFFTSPKAPASTQKQAADLWTKTALRQQAVNQKRTLHGNA
jgi:ferredoxin